MAKQEQFLRNIKKRAKKGAKFNPTGQHPGLKNLSIDQEKKKSNITYQQYKKLILGN
jgi:hypothetical protein